MELDHVVEVRSIRALSDADWPEWRRMRCALWPDSAADADGEMRWWLERGDTAVLVCTRANGLLCGFAEAGTRPYADGCVSSPVAFLEGWYVDPDVRGEGVGRSLVEAVEAWARKRGLSELASDADLENEIAHRAHEGVGFEEVERAVRYRKAL
jgi:aminoglycoside 6'-N-acetyltransferase I